jgi:O-antigen/teichoic acid export membrane protein
MTVAAPYSFIHQVNRFWNSDLFVSWGGLAMRLASAIIVTPFILIFMPANEAAIWLLLQLIFGFNIVVSFGLQATYTRFISYAVGGATIRQLAEGRPSIQPGTSGDFPASVPDIEALSRVTNTLCGVGFSTSIFSALIFSVGAGLASLRPIAELGHPALGWTALSVTVITTTLTVWGQTYISFLLGVGHVLALRRWELITGIGQTISILAAIWLGGGLLALVFVANAWLIFGVIRNAFLTRQYDIENIFKSARPSIDSVVWRAAWSPQWRLGFAVLFTAGVVQLSGIAAAQFLGPAALASYLFHLRLIQTVNNFSLPPLYNRLPQLSAHFAEGRDDLVRDIARRRMSLAYWSFCGAFLAIGFIGGWFIKTFTHAGYQFSSALWAAFGLSFFMERVAGMNAQLVMLTNRVPYLLNLTSGLIYLVVTFTLAPSLGEIAFPVGYLAGLTLASAPIVMFRAHRLHALPFPEFELRTLFFPLLGILAYTLLSAMS